MARTRHVIILLALFGILIIIACGSPASTRNQGVNMPLFTKQIIHDDFISEGVATADFNKDGQKDVLAGSLWFEAPEWQAHEIRPLGSFDYAKGYSDSFLNFTTDVDQDGWEDAIIFGFPGQGVHWYRNPGADPGHWSEHLIDSNACNESPLMADVDEDGRPDLVFANQSNGTMCWVKSPTQPGQTQWQKFIVSAEDAPGTHRFAHGLGLADVNKDGRKDILIKEGWWEAPTNRQSSPWDFHAVDLGEDCSQMYTYDFDDDGDLDVLSSSAHKFGIWWHESDGQAPDPSFRRHLIDSSYSQTHGIALTDLNGDDLPDLITGKRYFAHLGKDPGGLDPVVIYWHEFSRDKDNRPQWVARQIDDDSGIGLQVVVEDVNGDGKLDILNANKKGVIVFWGG